jgi:hypothetical protein
MILVLVLQNFTKLVEIRPGSSSTLGEELMIDCP